MGTTARGLRYPEPTDRLNETAQFIENLAADVDAQLGALDNNNTRIQAATVTLQANVNGRVYAPCGFTFNPLWSVARVTRAVSGTDEVDGMAITGYGSGAVYLAGGGAVAGNVVTIVVVDVAP